eukprot:3614597-Amphidinium_carterae.1
MSFVVVFARIATGHGDASGSAVLSEDVFFGRALLRVPVQTRLGASTSNDTQLQQEVQNSQLAETTTMRANAILMCC